jgi:hypothetical protein
MSDGVKLEILRTAALRATREAVADYFRPLGYVVRFVYRSMGWRGVAFPILLVAASLFFSVPFQGLSRSPFSLISLLAGLLAGTSIGLFLRTAYDDGVARRLRRRLRLELGEAANQMLALSAELMSERGEDVASAVDNFDQICGELRRHTSARMRRFYKLSTSNDPRVAALIRASQRVDVSFGNVHELLKRKTLQIGDARAKFFFAGTILGNEAGTILCNEIDSLRPSSDIDRKKN